MIIFDLDGTLANCEHRRHFIDSSIPHANREQAEEFIRSGCKWKPDWKAFYESCDKDKSIDAVISTMKRLSPHKEVKIWSGRCQSVRDKTIDWLYRKIPFYCPLSWFDKNLKMRAIGDFTPDDILKEKWLDEELLKENKIDFVFDSCAKSIKMWKRRGIFVFDCNQNPGIEF